MLLAMANYFICNIHVLYNYFIYCLPVPECNNLFVCINPSVRLIGCCHFRYWKFLSFYIVEIIRFLYYIFQGDREFEREVAKFNQ